MTLAKKLGLYLLSTFYILAGLNHFWAPEFYERMMPPYLPAHHLLVILSGIAEVFLGALALYPPTRRLSAWGIVLLLTAVFPANLYMYQLGGAHFGMSDIGLLLRLPAQLLLIAWAYLYTRR